MTLTTNHQVGLAALVGRICAGLAAAGAMFSKYAGAVGAAIADAMGFLGGSTGNAARGTFIPVPVKTTRQWTRPTTAPTRPLGRPPI